MKKITILLLIVCLIFGISACGKYVETSEITETSTPTPVETPTETKVVQTEFATIEDHAGRIVELPEQPEKIVSGYYITSSILIGLGLEDKMVGIENKADTRNIYALSAPQLLEIPGVGTSKDFNVELTASLEPELVILPLKLEETADILADMGIPAICVNPEDDELLTETIHMLAQATGTEERAEEMLAVINSSNKELEISFTETEVPTVYFGGNSDFLNTAGKNMYQNTLLEMANVENVAAEIEDTYWVTISYEQLISYNPDYIIIAPAASYTAEDVLNNPNLQELDCIKNGNVLAMPWALESWDSPLPSSFLGSLWIASQIHPDVVSFDDFTMKTTDFYKEFYDFDVDSTVLVSE